MAILHQLELNQSFFFQLVIFVIAYLALSQLVFKNYTKALTERETKTKGGEDLAQEIHQKAEDLRHQYESRAREVNGNIKTIFDEYRDQANKEYEQIVARARSESQRLIEIARQKVTGEIGQAQAQIKAEAPMIAQEMTRKLLAQTGHRG